MFHSWKFKSVNRSKKNGKIIPFHSLKGSLVYLNSQEEIELAFVQLATFIDYLIKTYGKENFIQFVNSFKNVKDDILNYKKIYKSDFEKLYNNWLHFVDEKEEYVKQYPGAKHDIKFIKGDEENNLIGLDIQGYIHLGEKFYSQKNYKIALYEYQKALKLQPYNPVVMARIGKIYFLQKNFTESEKILLDCVTVNPNFVPAYETLINLYYDTGVYEKILQLYPVILSINPFNHKIRKIVAEVYTDLGKIEKAIYEYQLLKLLLPEDKEIDILLSSLEQYIEMKKGLKK